MDDPELEEGDSEEGDKESNVDKSDWAIFSAVITYDYAKIIKYSKNSGLEYSKF